MPATTASASLTDQLTAELDALARLGRRRCLRRVDGVGRRVTRDGRRLLNLASNDYLALASHPRLRAAAAAAARDYGPGATASRLIVGHHDLHARVEARFAAFKHAQAGVLFSTGFMANLGVLTALAGPGDLVCLDKLVHASLIDAARASGATVRTFTHLDATALAQRLARHAATADEVTDPLTRRTRPARRFAVTDSVFSMDGDTADLPALLEVCDAHDATLVVDEAHATGLLGETGAGLAEAQGVAGRVPITVSTASKALAGLGGIVTADRTVVDALVNRARSLIYTTGATPVQAATLDAALDVVQAEPTRRDRLADMSLRVRDALAAGGWPLPASAFATPIVPLIVGDADAALALADRLEHAGILGVAIRPPTVSPGTARVRLCLRADLTDADVDQLLAAVGTPT